MKNPKKVKSMDWVSGKVKGFQGKSLIEMENGSLKMIKVAPFATYPDHLHPNKTEYAFVLKGKLKITIDNEVYNGQKDDFFIFPNAIKHRIENPFDEECLLLIGAIKMSNFI